jgi:hypothetical protein
VISHVPRIAFEFATKESIAADLFVIGTEAVETKPEYGEVE